MKKMKILEKSCREDTQRGIIHARSRNMLMLYNIPIPVILIAAFLPLLCEGIPTVLYLERTVSFSSSTNFSHLVQRDKAMHDRILQSSNGVINYTLGGTGDFSVGLYYTRIQLGTPPSNFYVQVDTGSDLTWIGCVPCTYCSMSTWIPNITLHLYNPSASSTYSAMSCYDNRCPTGIRASGSNCSEDNHHCLYSVNYADHSSISGFYVQELLSYDHSVDNSRTVTSTVPFVFGCTTVENQFSSTSRTDGILGLGHRGISLISQLADQGRSPKVFLHCLRGDGDGGGVLVLGEIVEPDIVYSPIIPSQPHYNLDLQKISVNGQILPIDPLLLSSPGEQGAIIDSGTTFMYLEIEALMQVISAINASTSAQSMPSSINQLCYLVTSTVGEVFPQVILHFAGGADLILGPRDYLLYEGSVIGGQMWCTGFQAATGGGRQTIVGDLVMKNKYIIYDLIKQRIGWKNYNCSAPVHVSTGIIKPKHGRTKRSDAPRSSSVPLQLVSLFFLELYLHHIP